MFEVNQRLHDFTLEIFNSLGVTAATSFEVNRQSRVVSKRSGDTIWRFGEPIAHWSYIVDGMVAELVNLGQGMCYPLSLHGCGSCFAKHELITDGVARVDYVALTDVELLTLPTPAYLELLKSEPGFSQHLISTLSRQVQQQTNLLIVNKCSNAALRVLAGMALCAEGFGPLGCPGKKGEPADSLLLPMPQQMISRLCGVSRTLFSEYVGQLEHGNWVRLKYRGVELQHLHVWQNLFEHLHSHQIWWRNPSFPQLLSLLDDCAASL